MSHVLNEPAHQQNHVEHVSLDILAAFREKFGEVVRIGEFLNEKEGPEYRLINYVEKQQ